MNLTAGAQRERVRVRQAHPADATAVDQLVAAAYAHDYGPREHGDGANDPMQRSTIRAREYDVWVAEDGAGTILGTVTTRRPGGPSLHEDVAGDELDLRLLGVAPAARRRGVGVALMRFTQERAAAAGFRAVVLKTGPQMHGAHRLYESLGYERRPERDGLWIGGARQLDLLMYERPVHPLVTVPLTESAGLRGVMGSFPTGVVAVTARGTRPGQPPAALTVQSFVSLSLEPPRVLFTIGTGSRSWPALAAAGSCALTVLAHDQAHIARALARPGHPDKLAGIATVGTPVHGHPAIAGGSVWLECALRDEFDGGDHRIVVADVLGCGPLARPETVAGAGAGAGAVAARGGREARVRSAPPLVYAASQFGRVATA